MKFFITPNNGKDDIFKSTTDLCQLLHRHDGVILMTDEDKEIYGDMCDAYSDNYNELMKECDVVIAIGGDGTMLRSASRAAAFDKPVLGINLGRLGFMAGLEISELELVSNLFSGSYKTQERMMLDVNIFNGEKCVFSGAALNDIVISRGNLSPIIDIYVRHNNNSCLKYRSDGVIISTPTGSTAYSFSSGGPVVDPSIKSIILTPVCPHSALDRSLVFSNDSLLEIKIKIAQATIADISLDGDKTYRICDGDKIMIKQSSLSAKFIMIKQNGFLQTFIDKLYHMMEDNYV